MSEPSKLSRNRAQQRPDGSRPDYRTLILDTTATLLTTTDYQDLSVQDIHTSAGVSRVAFYSYFASKGSVLATLVDNTNAAAKAVVDPLVLLPIAASPFDVIAGMVAAGSDRWAQYRHIYKAAYEHWTTVPEVRTAWLAAHQFHTDIWVDTIEHRLGFPRDHAHPAIRARAAALVWSSTQMLYLATTNRDPNLPDFDTVTDVLTSLWQLTLFAPPPPARSPEPPRPSSRR